MFPLDALPGNFIVCFEEEIDNDEGEEKTFFRSRLSSEPRDGELFFAADFCLGDFNLAS